MTKHVSIANKHKIVALREAGLSWEKIRLQLGLKCRSTARYIFKNYLQTGYVDRKEGSGKRKKVSDYGLRQIKRMVTKNPFANAESIRVEFNSFSQTSISTKTLRRILHDMNIFGRAAAKKI